MKKVKIRRQCGSSAAACGNFAPMVVTTRSALKKAAIQEERTEAQKALKRSTDAPPPGAPLQKRAKVAVEELTYRNHMKSSSAPRSAGSVDPILTWYNMIYVNHV